MFFSSFFLLAGEKCQYRHALPPGFVLKSEKKKSEEDAEREREETPVEEMIENVSA